MSSEPPTATYLPDLLAAIQIPDNGTLSRVLYRDESIRLVVFAFDTGQELTDHAASSSAIVQVLAGRIELVLNGDPVEVVPGGWVHMSPHLPHAVRALEPTVMVLTLVAGESKPVS
jgi:quercetin dioxygenase-like cupin family protein